MNHLVFLDARAGELEKILSGVKTMLVKEFDPAPTHAHPVRPGDSLYFLRDRDECVVRVKATVVRVLPLAGPTEKDLTHTMKAMQSRLHLTEDQFNLWSAKEQVLLVEFESARKIEVVQIASQKLVARPEWIAFEEFSQIA